MVGLDLRDREKKFKDGRHVGLDFYDLLIEGDYSPEGITSRLPINQKPNTRRQSCAICGAIRTRFRNVTDSPDRD
jgi:hypothetical protein